MFRDWPAPVQKKLREVRELIFETAEKTNTGPLTETLKWGQPAYLTEATKSGTTIRLGWQEKSAQFAVFVSCQTTLVETFRQQFSETLRFEGNRAIVFDIKASIPKRALRSCLGLALCYHER